MKQTITESQFIDAIVGDDYNNMSYEGAKALFEYLEQYEDRGVGEEIEFDRVAIRCDFSEYMNLEEVLDQYSHDMSIKTLSDLQDHTIVIEIEGTDRLIIQQF